MNCTEDVGGSGYKINRQFRIDFENVNEAPTNIMLTPSNINEHNQVDALVGTVSFTDPDNLVSWSQCVDHTFLRFINRFRYCLIVMLLSLIEL